ncbi:hypothetical protein ACIHEI_26790 [Kitasatospora sp. NPDC051984]
MAPDLVPVVVAGEGQAGRAALAVTQQFDGEKPAPAYRVPKTRIEEAFG